MSGQATVARRRPRVAIFDHVVTERSPAGSCHLRIVEALKDDIDFTVFAPVFDNPDPDRVRWVHVRAPLRPLVALFVAYYMASVVARYFGRHRHFDLLQTVEDYAPAADVSYAHFCHRTYLRKHWKASRPAGIRRLARGLDHRVRALLEPRAFRRAKWIVVPAEGLAAEIGEEYPWARHKLRVVPNPVDLAHLRRPPDFDPAAVRHQLGIADDAVVLVFVALGQFERKGLPFLFDALSAADRRSHVLVVGGQEDLVRAYRARADEMGLGGRVTFTGMQDDVRPFLWASDALVMASSYEVFPLAALQGAAAGLPLVTTRVPGTAFVVDGVSGIVTDRQVTALRSAIDALVEAGGERRRAMGIEAMTAVAPYSVDDFLDCWSAFYAEVIGQYPLRENSESKGT